MIFYGWSKAGKPIILRGPVKAKRKRIAWPYVFAAASMALALYGVFR